MKNIETSEGVFLSCFLVGPFGYCLAELEECLLSALCNSLFRWVPFIGFHSEEQKFSMLFVKNVFTVFSKMQIVSEGKMAA